jgi:hypothetical protein
MQILVFQWLQDFIKTETVRISFDIKNRDQFTGKFHTNLGVFVTTPAFPGLS